MMDAFEDHKSWLKPMVLSLVLLLLHNMEKLSWQVVCCLLPVIFWVVLDTIMFYAAVLTVISKTRG